MDNLKLNFGKRKVKEGQKTSLVQKVFSEVSEKYDLMNDFMSLGTHRLWKKRLIEIMNIQKNDIILDVGSGTGDLPKLILNFEKTVYMHCLDLNKTMLSKSKKKFIKTNYKIKFINANAEKLSYKDNFFDKYVICFCLRNITDIKKALEESFRVLKPGGIFYCLEFSEPDSFILNSLYKKYKKKIIPIMGKKIAKNENAYRYLEESISQFPNQENLIIELKKIGYEKTKYINLFNGIVSVHIGHKTL